MFDVGFSELVFIALLALIVLGPKRLPEVARAAGRWLAKLRNFVSNVKQDLHREMHNAEILELHRLKQELDDTRRLMQDASGQMMQKLGVTSGDGHSIAGGDSVKTAAAPAAPAKAKRKRKPARAKKASSTTPTKSSRGRVRTAKRR
jgi:sec-independent protein translocase protein TatB